jgi:hypothetical protein
MLASCCKVSENLRGLAPGMLSAVEHKCAPRLRLQTHETFNWNESDGVPLALIFAQEHGAGLEAPGRSVPGLPPSARPLLKIGCGFVGIRCYNHAAATTSRHVCRAEASARVASEVPCPTVHHQTKKP